MAIARETTGFVLGLACAVVLACERPPTEGMRDWTAADHGGERAQDKGAQAAQGPKAPRAAGTNPAGTTANGSSISNNDDVMIDTTWQMACAPCHGTTGRGDGPNGPQNQARDFSDPAWQKAANDVVLASSIKNGKGTKMPKFDLPDELVVKLVAKIRKFSR